ncbi:TldD/PmbA family protein [Phenylobacterium soli]|uniref:TldD/PmbA family protein n=1 Tax=Phenylobacterium soli TaxID=2170551 RepID=A0A328AAW9_9CAUL|nr:TldD/PmbA family protein [Phenylobacterium soli]RAK51913.1 TldD/PmbA family protein [Phenylobacterium soli]
MNQDLLNEVVQAALKAGADAAEAVGAERRALSITVRLGELEEVEREEARDLGLRVFVGKRQATVSGSDISAEARAKLVERAVAMARLAPEDPYAGLADPALLARGDLPDLDLFDASEPSPETLEDRARAAEEAARAVERVTNTDGASGSWSASQWAMVTSGGFAGVHRASGFSLGATAIAGDENGMEIGYDGRSTRWQSDLPSPESIGAEAGRRAAQRLGARKIASTTAPVIFENRLAASLIGPMIGAISGPSIARGTSFLKDKLGEKIFGEHVTITDDPHRPRGLGSAPFDDEGVANQKRNLIDRGVLTTWLLNASSARQLGLTSTGHASRGLAGPPGVGPSNLTVLPGDKSQAELIREAKSGLLVTNMFGPSLNGNTGDWSVGCAGFWFEDGELAYPVTEITVAGNLIDIYARLIPGSDLEIRGATNSPSLLVDSLAIAGL